MSKIRVEGVDKSFPDRQSAFAASAVLALSHIDLNVEAGEFMVLVGPSGCGKSTLLDMLSGLAAPSSGMILIDGKPITGPGPDRGTVFQQYALFPWRTALGNVEFALEAAGLPRAERAERGRHFLALVGLSGFEHHYPHQLSGGMKQRVAIARSLSHDPDILLMDEPFAALDAQTREALQDELLRIWQETGKTIVFVTHGIEEAVYLGQRVAVMSARPGRIIDVVDIRLGPRTGDDDLRSSPKFSEIRHHIWTLLRSEVRTATRH
ncbi:MAG TPA: ABC transporter ATP-binding protein [Stellaceae bacterium]|nr:ABC transporter ATP-binding protein [Stellaceae bacterium]